MTWGNQASPTVNLASNVPILSLSPLLLIGVYSCIERGLAVSASERWRILGRVSVASCIPPVAAIAIADVRIWVAPLLME
jgi:hypothetical protein